MSPISHRPSAPDKAPVSEAPNFPVSGLIPHPLVSVILPCRNEAKSIENCIHSLLTQQPVEGGFELILADGLSEDGTREILAKMVDGRVKMEDRGLVPEKAASSRIEARTFPISHLPSPIASAAPSAFRSHPSSLASPEIPGPASGLRSQVSSLSSSEVHGQWSVVSGHTFRVIGNPARITPSGLNAAIRAARGDIIIRMDAHTEYAPDYVQRCVDVLRETGADNVGGPARTKAETYMQKAVAAAYHSPFSVGGARFHDVNYEGWVDTVTYGCWPRATFDKFGYFDEELVRNQDDEHNLRIIRGGGRIYQSPKIRSWYKPRGSLAALFRQYMQYGYWKVRVIQKHKLPASWRHLVPGAFVLTMAVLFLLSTFCFLLFGSDDFRFQVSSFILFLLASSYSLAALTASLLTARKTEWRLLPVLPAVFACYHFGYGYGFLRGLWDFVIRRKKPQAQFAKLTR